MARVYIGIGSNIGDSISNIRKAVSLLESFISNIQRSSIYKSLPYGPSDQPYFLNLVISGETDLSPEELLANLKNLENKLGRQVRGRWREREIDLDILLYDDLIIQKENISIPHSDMHNRDFVLVPLLELSPEIQDPRNNLLFKDYLPDIKTKTIIEKAPVRQLADQGLR